MELTEVLDRHRTYLLALVNSPRYVAAITPELRADAAAFDVAAHYLRDLARHVRCAVCGEAGNLVPASMAGEHHRYGPTDHAFVAWQARS